MSYIKQVARIIVEIKNSKEEKKKREKEKRNFINTLNKECKFYSFLLLLLFF